MNDMNDEDGYEDEGYSGGVGQLGAIAALGVVGVFAPAVVTWTAATVLGAAVASAIFDDSDK